jgi:hypothetical protein
MRDERQSGLEHHTQQSAIQNRIMPFKPNTLQISSRKAAKPLRVGIRTPKALRLRGFASKHGSYLKGIAFKPQYVANKLTQSC